jgi:hypothetical protein
MDIQAQRFRYRSLAVIALLALLVIVLLCPLSFLAIQSRMVQPPTFSAHISGSTYLLSIVSSEPCPGVNCNKWTYELCFTSVQDRPLILISIPLDHESP